MGASTRAFTALLWVACLAPACGERFQAGPASGGGGDDAAAGGNEASGNGTEAGSASGTDAGGGDGERGGGASGGGEAGTPAGGGGLDAACERDADCDDDDVCNGLEHCEEGACVGGEPLVCPPDQNPCTTTECHPRAGCLDTPNSEGCDDGNPCTLEDVCNNAVCGGTPKDCGNEVCNETSGGCECAPGQIRCGESCKAAVCCPGATAGSCGRCGIKTCNDAGTAFECLGEHGNCDPGWSCQGLSCNPVCLVGQRRECHDCTMSGCF